MPTATTTLHIRFTGLCLFVRDPHPPAAGGELAAPRVHVLLVRHGARGDGSHAAGAHDARPAVGHAAGEDAHPRHCPRLIYTKDHERPDFFGNRNGEPVLACRNLDGRVLSLGDQSPDGLTLDFPSGLVDLNTISGVGKLPRAYLGANPPTGVVARLTFTSGKVTTKPGVKWRNDCESIGNLPPWEGELSTEATWEITGLPPGPMTLRFRSLTDESREIETLQLQPVNGRILLGVMNSPFEDLPPTLARTTNRRVCSGADHFPGFYSVFPDAPLKVVPGLVKPIDASTIKREDDIWDLSSDAKPHLKGVEDRTSSSALLATELESVLRAAFARDLTPGPLTCGLAAAEAATV